MSKPGALTSSGVGDGVQMQAEVTGLTQFLLNIGIAGFKHHAQAGVDTHTILSMLAIAEVCPASMQYRIRLNQHRDEQRRQSVWLYKVVEVGARVNFIVDQLLQTQAGENIMAMMSALAPLLSRTAFNTTILNVFEKRNSAPDSVPGLAQLEKFRDTILPLACGMDVKDTVLQYHKWMVEQLASKKSMPQQLWNDTDTNDSYTAMPDSETVANVICYLARMTNEQDKGLILAYHGLKGAAWIAAYAQNILSLPVSIFVDEHTAVPFSGDHISARVILRLYSTKRTCELQRIGKVEDFFKIPSASVREEKRWTIDVRTTKYYNPQQSAANSSQNHVYELLARPVILAYVRALAKSFNRSSSENRWTGMKRFAVARLHSLQERALANMQLLGFDCSIDAAKNINWKDFIVCHTGKDRRLAASKLWADTFGSDLLDSSSFELVSSQASYHDTHHDATGIKIDFNIDGEEAIGFLMKAVNFAATMAFTNWGQDFFGMSVRYMVTGWKKSWLSEDSRPLLYRDPRSIQWRDPILELRLNGHPIRFDTTDLLRYAIHISMDTDENPSMKRFLDNTNNLIALNWEGLVVVRAMALPDVRALQQVEVLSFHPGSIVYKGENMTSIKSESSVLESSAELVTRVDQISPLDAVRDLELRSRSLAERHEVLVETQIMLGSECCQLADPIAISEMIPQLLVSDQCMHDYNTAFTVPKRIETRNEVGDRIYHAAPVWQGGLSFQSKHRPRQPRSAGMKVYVQSVDQNPEAQWIACQWTSDWDPFATILQENSCLECIYNSVKHLPLAEICIINGGTGETLRPRGQSQPQASEHLSDVEHDGTFVGDGDNQKSPNDQSRRRNIESNFDNMGIPVTVEASSPEPSPSRSKWPSFSTLKKRGLIRN